MADQSVDRHGLNHGDYVYVYHRDNRINERLYVVGDSCMGGLLIRPDDEPNSYPSIIIYDNDKNQWVVRGAENDFIVRLVGLSAMISDKPKRVRRQLPERNVAAFRATKNARTEFLEEIEDRTVSSASILYTTKFYKLVQYNSDGLPKESENGPPPYEDEYYLCLSRNHSEEEYQDFLEDLNFVYDSGFGSQELYGVIWYTDGTWSVRRGYDGSEDWEHVERPKTPEICGGEESYIKHARKGE